MQVTPVLSLAKLFVTGKRMKLLLVGAQFGYLGYRYLKSRKKKRKQKSSEAVKTS